MALVSGCDGQHSIGRAIAMRLAKEGTNIIVNDLTENPKNSSTWAGLPSVVEVIEGLGRKAIAKKADISNSGHVNLLIQDTIKEFGLIEILVNNAGSNIGPDRVSIVELE